MLYKEFISYPRLVEAALVFAPHVHPLVLVRLALGVLLPLLDARPQPLLYVRF